MVVLGNEIVVDLLRLFVSLCEGKTCSVLCTNNGWSVTVPVSEMMVVASYNGALVSVDVEMIENLRALETVVNLSLELAEKTETISDWVSWELDCDQDTCVLRTGGDGVSLLTIWRRELRGLDPNTLSRDNGSGVVVDGGGGWLVVWMLTGSWVKTSGYIISGVDVVSAVVPVFDDVVIWILDNGPDVALSLDSRASSSSAVCSSPIVSVSPRVFVVTLVDVVVVVMDGVGDDNDRFAFLINLPCNSVSGFSASLFIIKSKTTLVLVSVSGDDLFGAALLLLMKSDGSDVKIGNVFRLEDVESRVTCTSLPSSSDWCIEFLSSRSSSDLSVVFMTFLSLLVDLSSLAIISGPLNLIN